MHFEFDSRNTQLEIDAVCLATKVLILREDLETSKKMEVDVTQRTVNELAMKNEEIESLNMELSTQKALNKQLFIRVTVAETDNVAHTRY